MTPGAAPAGEPAASTLDATWADLEADAERRVGPGLVVRRVAPGSPADIYLAVERQGGARAVLVTVPANSVDRGALDLACAGIEARTYVLDPGDRARVTVGVRLSDAGFADVFGALAADLVARLSAVAAPADAAPVLFGHLLRWQQFLRRLDPAGLSPEAQRGLYAELRFLRDHAVPAAGPEPAVAGWVGPARAAQDFHLGPRAVEVKSHAGNLPQEVRISNARQLDDTGLEVLLLYLLSLDMREGAGETLTAIVDEVRGALAASPLARATFDERLLEAGYLDAHRSRYARVGYLSRGEFCYRVVPGFPRIVERDLAAGVGSVSYSISPAACTAFAVPTAHVRTLLGPPEPSEEGGPGLPAYADRGLSGVAPTRPDDPTVWKTDG